MMPAIKIALLILGAVALFAMIWGALVWAAVSILNWYHRKTGD